MGGNFASNPWYITSNGSDMMLNATNMFLRPASGYDLVIGDMGSPQGVFCHIPVTVQNTSASTSTTTGALTVAGGVGIGGSINVSNILNVGLTASGSTSILNALCPNANTDWANTQFVLGQANSGKLAFKLMYVNRASSANNYCSFQWADGTEIMEAQTASLGISPTTASTSTSTGSLLFLVVLELEVIVILVGHYTKEEVFLRYPILIQKKLDCKLRHCFVELNTRGTNLYEY